MSRKHHYLKIEPKYFNEILKGKKKFELRKNDRDFKVHDILHLEESVNGVKTGNQLPAIEIQYIFYGGEFGLEEGYCIMNW